MTTSKPDGAGPTVENFNKASECWDVIGNMTDFREATRERVVEVIAQYLSSERVEAEKKIKDLELRYRAARNILGEVYKVNYSSGKKQVELDIEVEYQRLKEGTSEGK